MSAKTSPQTREQKQRMRVSKKASDAFLVLVVEDEHFLSDIYEHQLKKEGFQVLVAHNGEEALAFMKKQKPQVILLDLVMPKMNGFEFLEHLSKEDGQKLIAIMEKLAKKKVIIFTPNGFLPQKEFDGNTYQAHLSGWEVEEMKAKGYRVLGMSGWKKMKGERAELKWWPKKFWERIGLFTEPILFHFPKHSFEILCVKEL